MESRGQAMQQRDHTTQQLSHKKSIVACEKLSGHERETETEGDRLGDRDQKTET